MYYRVAIHQPAEHLDQPQHWQWTSTVLSSLEALFHFLRLYGALRLDRLGVFSSSSREGLEEQLVQENQGLLFTSVTAAHFLQERLIHISGETRATSARAREADLQVTSIAVASQLSMNESNRQGNSLIGSVMSALESRRLEFERGPGGDHDVPYRFVLPTELLPVRAWMRLLARIQRGELLP